jgi:hypothetical protein
MVKAHCGYGRSKIAEVMNMGKHAKTVKLLEVAVEVLTAQPLMTVRQAYYQLVSR